MLIHLTQPDKFLSRYYIYTNYIYDQLNIIYLHIPVKILCSVRIRVLYFDKQFFIVYCLELNLLTITIQVNGSNKCY